MKIKILFKIISIMLLIIMLFPHTVTFAADVATVGNAIAAFAMDYYNKAHAGTSPIITHPWTLHNKNWPANWKDYRALDITTGLPPLNPYSGKVSKSHYGLDCVGWVSFCIYNATGISETGVHDGSDGYVVPMNCNNPKTRQNFDVVEIGPSEVSALQTGDILITEDHVLIYANNGGTHTFIHSWYNEGPYLHTYDNLPDKYKTAFKARARVKPDKADLIDETTLNTNATLIAGNAVSAINAAGITESEFYYNGVPDGRYSVADSFWVLLIEALKDIFTFLVNILFFIFRMVFVGFTAIFELLITFIIESIVGKSNLKIDTTTPEASGSITIEKIFFNDINVFDVNFFKSTP